jgi:hypothetical protein
MLPNDTLTLTPSKSVVGYRILHRREDSGLQLFVLAMGVALREYDCHNLPVSFHQGAQNSLLSLRGHGNTNRGKDKPE